MGPSSYGRNKPFFAKKSLIGICNGVTCLHGGFCNPSGVSAGMCNCPAKFSVLPYCTFPVSSAFKQTFSSGRWISDPVGSYICNSNKNYCQFSNPVDGVSYCHTDPTCRGFAVKPDGTTILIRANTIASPSDNAEVWEKPGWVDPCTSITCDKFYGSCFSSAQSPKPVCKCIASTLSPKSNCSYTPTVANFTLNKEGVWATVAASGFRCNGANSGCTFNDPLAGEKFCLTDPQCAGFFVRSDGTTVLTQKSSSQTDSVNRGRFYTKNNWVDPCIRKPSCNRRAVCGGSFPDSGKCVCLGGFFLNGTSCDFLYDETKFAVVLPREGFWAPDAFRKFFDNYLFISDLICI